MFGEETVKYLEMEGNIKVINKQGSGSALENARAQMATTRKALDELTTVYKAATDITPPDVAAVEDALTMADGLQLSRDNVRSLIARFGFLTVQEMLTTLTKEPRKEAPISQHDKMRAFLGVAAPPAQKQQGDYPQQMRKFLGLKESK